MSARVACSNVRAELWCRALGRLGPSWGTIDLLNMFQWLIASKAFALPFTHEQLYKSNPEISLLTCRAASRGRVTFFLKSARTQRGSFSSLTSPMEQLPMTPVLKSSLPAQTSVDQTHFIFDLHPEFLLTSHSYLLYMWGGPGVWARSLGQPRSERPVRVGRTSVFLELSCKLIDWSAKAESQRAVCITSATVP